MQNAKQEIACSKNRKKDAHTERKLVAENMSLAIFNNVWNNYLSSVSTVAPFFFEALRGRFGLISVVAELSIWLGAYPESLLPFGSADRGAGAARLATTDEILQGTMRQQQIKHLNNALQTQQNNQLHNNIWSASAKHS